MTDAEYIRTLAGYMSRQGLPNDEQELDDLADRIEKLEAVRDALLKAEHVRCNADEDSFSRYYMMPIREWNAVIVFLDAAKEPTE